MEDEARQQLPKSSMVGSRYEDKNVSHNADVSVPSVPAKPQSLVKRLQSEEDKTGSRNIDIINSMIEPNTHSTSFLNFSSHPRNPKSRPTKSIQLFKSSYDDV